MYYKIRFPKRKRDCAYRTAVSTWKIQFSEKHSVGNMEEIKNNVRIIKILIKIPLSHLLV